MLEGLEGRRALEMIVSRLGEFPICKKGWRGGAEAISTFGASGHRCLSTTEATCCRYFSVMAEAREVWRKRCQAQAGVMQLWGMICTESWENQDSGAEVAYAKSTRTRESSRCKSQRHLVNPILYNKVLFCFNNSLEHKEYTSNAMGKFCSRFSLSSTPQSGECY